MGEGDRIPRGGTGACPSEIFWNEYALRCNLVHFETQFCEMFRFVHWLRRIWMIFLIYLIIYWNDNNFFWGGGWGSLCPSNTLDRTLPPSSNAVFKIQTLLVQCHGNIVVDFIVTLWIYFRQLADLHKENASKDSAVQVCDFYCNEKQRDWKFANVGLPFEGLLVHTLKSLITILRLQVFKSTNPVHYNTFLVENEWSFLCFVVCRLRSFVVIIRKQL